MFELYAYATPNSLKAAIALEEMRLDYVLTAVNLRQGAQHSAAFKKLNPNEKVPVLFDRTQDADFALSESAAILVYLAEKTGQLLPESGCARAKVFEQMFFHASALSPAFLQAFLVAISSAPALEVQTRALLEVERVLGVLDQSLAKHTYAAGDYYSIADIAHFGWIWRHQAVGTTLEKFQNVARWYAEVSERSAVIKAIAQTTALAK